MREGAWVTLPIGVADSYRMAGFSRWFVQEIRPCGEVRLCRSHLGLQYSRTIEPQQVAEWETCNAPRAWAP
jgi:hypothetical protein